VIRALRIIIIVLLLAAFPAELYVSKLLDQDATTRCLAAVVTGFPLLIFLGAAVLAKHRFSIFFVLGAGIIATSLGIHAYYDELWRTSPFEVPVTWFAVPILQGAAALASCCAVFAENMYRKRQRSVVPSEN